MAMTQEQWDQIQKQLDAHTDDYYTILIPFLPENKKPSLEVFHVNAGVFRPDITASRYLAYFLAQHPDLYEGKDVIDIGSGTGLQGIVAAMYGARHVTLSDISDCAVRNTQENVFLYRLSRKACVYQGDLFEKIETDADVIIFNHPWFSGEPIPEREVSRAMLGGEDLIHRFLEDAKQYLRPDGVVVMSYFPFAGPENDPRLRGPEHGYNVEIPFETTVEDGLQQGNYFVCLLRIAE